MVGTCGGNGGHCTDLPQTFGCIDHYLLVAKLKAYELDNKPLNFLPSSLCLKKKKKEKERKKRKQRTKVHSFYIIYLFIWDLLDTGDIHLANYADDSTSYTC